LRDLRAIESKLKDGPGADIPAEALALAFEDVHFSYKEDEPVLEGINFQLEPGRVLGLLGRTGSGKTTLARLVFRLYDPTGGRVVLGGVPLVAPQVKALRERVALVTQDVQLFQASVRDNITFFDRSIPDEKILSVLHELDLDEWLQALPKGLDTKLETGGRSISAGEAQLLAFTRVFLRNPGLVILDEASSRLDPATEQLIERAIDKLLKKRTAIIIAHRLGTIHRTDDIMILEDGRIVEYGNRQRLAADPDTRFHGLLRTGLEEVLV
jgi:ATP-binding cassette subfamily B protein